LGDLDGDGDLDAFTVGTPNQVWLNDGTGTFTNTWQAPNESISVALGDVDGDGDLDAVVGNDGQPSEVWLNDGTGQFSESQSLTGTGRNFAIALGDLDGDGDLDIFVSCLGPGGSSPGAPDQVWFNDGKGHFVDSGQRLGNWLSASVALGDLDGDGDLDAFVGITASLNEEPNVVWLNDGRGYFSLYQEIYNDSYNIALGDVDGDGDLDAFIANAGPSQIWLNDGTGHFSLGHELNVVHSRNAALGDLDNDGDLDAFVVVHGLFQYENVDTVWLNQDSAIVGLTAANDGPTTLGQRTHLYTTVGSGSVSTYTWDFGDGTGGNDAEVSHMYTSVGTYTAVVTATNSTGLLTATTIVTIIPPLSIPSSGGTITPADGVTIAAGSGVFSDTVLISYSPQPVTATAPLSNAGLFFELSASYLSSGLPAQPQPGQHYAISVTYQQDDVPAGVDEADLALYYWDEAAWVEEPSSVADVAANTITASPDHFSLWAALARSPGAVQKTYLPLILKK
jgi:hypothetical protein